MLNVYTANTNFGFGKLLVLGKKLNFGKMGERLIYSRTHEPARLVDNSSSCSTVPFVRHLILFWRVRFCDPGDVDDYRTDDGPLIPHPRMRK